MKDTRITKYWPTKQFLSCLLYNLPIVVLVFWSASAHFQFCWCFCWLKQTVSPFNYSIMSDFYDACGRLVVAFRATKLYSSLYFQFVGLLEGFLNVERHLYSKKIIYQKNCKCKHSPPIKNSSCCVLF